MAKLRVNKIAAVGVSTETTGSVFFDGTGDNLVSKSSGLAPGSGSFTAEGWFNLPSTAGISNSSLFSSGIEPVLHWALIVDGGIVTDAQDEPDTWNRIDVGFGTYVAGFLVQKSNERVLFDVGITTTSVTLDFSTELDENFYYPGWLVSNDFVNNGWINKAAINTDSDGVITITDSTPFRYIKMRSLTNYGGANSTYANIATLQGYSPLDGADYAAWGVRRSSDNGNAYLYDGADWVDTGLSISQDTWNHVAVVRDSSVMNLYVNGTGYALTSYTNSNLSNSIISVSGFNTSGNVVVDPLRGYASNVRLTLEKELYTSNFILPTTELEVIGGTAFVGCYDGENVFAEKTGKSIAAYGDRLSSPTPTATDSPIGISTFNPGLVRSVNVSGPTFEGGVGYNSQNWLTLPKGTTTDRMPVFGGVQSGTRGFFAGAYSPSRSDTINYVTVPTLGNAIDFGNLSGANGGVAGFSDSTRGWVAGGNILPAGRVNIMEYVTMASSGNAVDGGDLITATQSKPGSVANSIRGIVAGGNTPGQVKTIVHHTIQTTGIAQNFGDLTEAKNQLAGVMSPTRGVFAGGTTPSGKVDTIEYITMASTGNAVLFGELSLDDRCQMGGASNTVRGLFGGGRNPSDFTHIEYITMATLGNGQDFGDLTQTDMDGDVGAVSNSTRVVFGGGSSDELGYVEIATLGNTTEFGKFTVQTTANQDPGCFSNGHGGLG